MHPEDIVRIPLRARDGSVRAYAIIDAGDLDAVSRWRWCLMNGRYAVRGGWVDGKRRSIYLHRFLLGMDASDPRECDHINRNTLDNRRSNLRIVPHAGNMQNHAARRNSRSGLRGVYRSAGKGERWMSRVMINGKVVHLGNFDTPEEAAAVAREARQRLMPYATD